MPGTARTANLPAGTPAPSTGIYVVTHGQPPHAQPHEVVVSELMTLPECQYCQDVRFSLKSYLIQPIEESEFFRLSN